MTVFGLITLTLILVVCALFFTNLHITNLKSPPPTKPASSKTKAKPRPTKAKTRRRSK